MIHLKNICKNFAKDEILKNIDLHIKEGECVVLKGVSGSGKSTLLSIIATLMMPSSGKVILNNLDISSLSDYDLSEYRRKTLGFVTQSFYLFDMLNVKDNILAALLPSKLSQNEIMQKLDDAMVLASIKHKSQTQVSRLSGGEKQRCMIARALVNKPNILLCDEPTANLDKENSLKFADIIRVLKKRGKTIIIATHDPLIIDLNCVDRIVNIEDGTIE